MDTPDLLIIGAGIAGLAAGCYGQMNGYRTEIVEMHTLPGGLCTAWQRQDYTFDGCIHWLVGSNPTSPMYPLWEELGAVQDRPIVDHEFYFQIEGPDKTLTFYNDIDRLEEHMKALSPADADVIAAFCDGARRLAGMEMPLDGPANPWEAVKMGVRMLPTLGAMWRWGRVPMHAFAARFRDPFLRQAFTSFYEDMEALPTLVAMMTLAMMHRQDAGYPVGGSLAFSRAIERRYRELGGQVHYRARVAEILVEGDRAVGVRLDDGAERRAQRVVSAADGHQTIFEMLGGRYVDDKIRGYYERWPIFPPIVQVSLGIRRDLSDMPHTLMMFQDEPVTVAGKPRDQIGLRHFCYDPTMAPAGASVITAIFTSEHAYWKALAEDRQRYDAEKRQAAEAVIAQLERCYPGITADIEVVNVATPLTTERFTGNWQGSMEGWLITKDNLNMLMGRGMRKTLPGLQDFYMVGQWVEPGGGVPTAAISGRNLIRRLCKEDGRSFTTTTPSNQP